MALRSFFKKQNLKKIFCFLLIVMGIYLLEFLQQTSPLISFLKFTLIFFAVFYILSHLNIISFSLSLSISYAIFLLTLFINTIIYRNEAQFQLIWVEACFLIRPFINVNFAIMHYIQTLFNSDNQFLLFVLSPFISHLLIGVPFFLMIGTLIDTLYFFGVNIIKFKKSGTLYINYNMVKYLFIKNLLNSLFITYLIICFGQWDDINFKNNIFLMRYLAEKNIENKTTVEPGIIHTKLKKIWFPYYIDSYRKKEFYNNAIKRLKK